MTRLVVLSVDCTVNLFFIFILFLFFACDFCDFHREMTVFDWPSIKSQDSRLHNQRARKGVNLGASCITEFVQKVYVTANDAWNIYYS